MDPQGFIIKYLSQESSQSLIIKKLTSKSKEFKKKIQKQEQEDLIKRDKIIKNQMAKFMKHSGKKTSQKGKKCFKVVFEAFVDKNHF